LFYVNVMLAYCRRDTCKVPVSVAATGEISGFVLGLDAPPRHWFAA